MQTKIKKDKMAVENWEKEIVSGTNSLATQGKTLTELEKEQLKQKKKLETLKEKHDWENVKDLIFDEEEGEKEPEFYEVIRGLEANIVVLGNKVLLIINSYSFFQFILFFHC